MGLDTLADRFWDKVEVAPGPNGCWLWEGFTHQGYGKIWGDEQHRSLAAHRVAYEMYVGPIPDGLTIDHVCRLRHCVNPAHLEPVTSTENHRRGQSGAQELAKTHCPNGHPYNEANTYIAKNGSRHCRACARDKGRADYQPRTRGPRCTVTEGPVRCRLRLPHDGAHLWWDAVGGSRTWTQHEYDRYEQMRDTTDWEGEGPI